MQIVYFPYINMDLDKIAFGDAIVWNFDRVAESFIHDNGLREHVRTLLDSNELNGRPLRNIGVLSIGETDFREFTAGEFEIAREVRLLMFLGYLSKNNVTFSSGYDSGHWVATSENFTFVIQNFTSGSDSIALQSGFIVRKLDGGYTLGEFKFNAPHHVPQPLRFRLDGELLLNLLKLKKRNKQFVERVLRATDLLFEAYFNDPYLSINARALLMCASFEVLLDLPDKSQRKVFKEKVKRYCCRLSNRKIRYTSERSRNPGYVWEIEPVKVMWADKFYTLRNHIIHGSNVKSNEFYFRNNESHFDIAPKFFVFMVKELINERLNKYLFNDDLVWCNEDVEGESYSYFEYRDSSIGRRLARISVN